MKRGEIWNANLDPRSGSEQSGRRPVIVVSSDGLNSAPNWMSIIVIPLSTSINQARRSVSTVPLFAGEDEVAEDCVAVCHQVTTVDRSKLIERRGEVSSEVMKLIEDALKAAMDFE